MLNNHFLWSPISLPTDWGSVGRHHIHYYFFHQSSCSYTSLVCLAQFWNLWNSTTKWRKLRKKRKNTKKNLSTSAYLLWWLYFEVYYILYHIIPLLETAQCFNFLLCLSKRLRNPRLKLINPIVEQKLLCKRTFVPIIGR